MGQGITASANTGELAEDGTFRTAVPGRNGAVEVFTTFSNGEIVSVEIGEHLEDMVFVGRAIETITDAIVNYQSILVDVVAGATITSMAIRLAVAEAILEAGGSLVTYSYTPTVIPQPDETINVDVVVVGGGLSGITAAAVAADSGAQVALLEKTTLLGGASLMSFMSFAYGTQVAVDAEDNVQQQIVDRFNMWLQREAFRVDANLLSMYLRNQGPAHDYLIEAGIFNPPGDGPFPAPARARPMLVMPYTARVPIFETMMQERVVDRGGYLFMETRGTELIYEDGAVIGVIAQRRDGSILTVYASSVVIATGGFGGNAQLVYERSGVRARAGAPITAQGDGIQMAWDVGARVPHNITGGLMLHQTLATADLTGREFDLLHLRMPMMLSYVPSLLRVDHMGRRYVNEGIPAGQLSAAVATSNSAAFTGGYTYILVSQQTINNLITGGLEGIGFTGGLGMPPQYTPPGLAPDIPWPYIQQVMDAIVEQGTGFFGNTIEELAVAAGMSPEVLRYHFDRYQTSALAGFDEWFGKNPDWMIPYCDGPFWFVQSTYNQLGTVSGLIVDTNLRVLDTSNNPIPGLFSVGNDASSTLYNNMYTSSGDGVGWAATSGFVGGAYAAAFALGE
ncbi:MAG: FAD-binding protein [Defluviitaleaceae bacterium]|nr:FAD-binding protein [Defluviitaleaceae bacterium]